MAAHELFADEGKIKKAVIGPKAKLETIKQRQERERDDQDIILSTKLGKCIRFMSKKLRIFKGRSSKGIKGIQLSENDSIISLSVVNSVKINGKIAKKTLKNGNSNKNKLSEISAMQKYILS